MSPVTLVFPGVWILYPQPHRAAGQGIKQGSYRRGELLSAFVAAWDAGGS